MQTVPPTFIQLHKIAGCSNEEIAAKWGDLNQKTATDLLLSLISDKTLSDREQEKIHKILTKLNDNKAELDVISLLAFVLTPEQVQKVSEKYVETLSSNLNQTYKTLLDRSSPAQKQAAQLFLEDKNG